MKDKKGNIINEHTKEKVQIYEKYLKAYLSVLLNSPYTKGINIYEPLAGMGAYSNLDGSALLSCRISSLIKDNKKNIPIKVFLNDKDKKSYDSLCISCGQYYPIITQKEAAHFILDTIKEAKVKYVDYHKFYFIDPYGYTQVNKDDINALLKLDKIELLFFIPISHIYRFINGNKEEKHLQGVFNFLKSYTISVDNIKKSDDLVIEIKNCFLREGRNFYVQDYPLKTKGNKYSLFFITKHIFGAEKFLEIMYKKKNDKKIMKFKEDCPLFCDFMEEKEQINPLNDKKEELYSFIRNNNNKINNVMLYKWLIQNSCLPKHFNILYKNKQLNIQGYIIEKGFCINYKAYKNNVITAYFCGEVDE